MTSAPGEPLLSLINDVLDLSKVEAGHMELEVQPFRSGRRWKTGSRWYGNARPRRGPLAFDVDAQVDVVEGDERRSSRSIQLISNAVKFTPGGGPVHVSTTQAPGEVRGRHRRHRFGRRSRGSERIFEEFQQSQPAAGCARGPGSGSRSRSGSWRSTAGGSGWRARRTREYVHVRVARRVDDVMTGERVSSSLRTTRRT